MVPRRARICGTEAGSYHTHSGSEAGSYLRLIDSCITQLKAQGPSRTCNESKEEEKKKPAERDSGPRESVSKSHIRGDSLPGKGEFTTP